MNSSYTKSPGILFIIFICLSSYAQNDENYRPRLGDRIYLTRTLKDIFGPASEGILHKGIFSQFHIFGAPCDPYSQHLEPKEDKFTVKGNYQKCNDKFFIEYRTPILVPSSPLRSGAIIKTCSKLVECKDCLKHGLKKASIDESKGFNINQGAKKIYRLFYPFSSEEKWQSLSKSLRENSNYWDSQKIFRLFCMSEGWQTL